MKKITSRQNPLIKHIRSLQEKSSLRKKEKLFIVEGKRELTLALKSGYQVDKIIFNPQIIPFPQLQQTLRKYDFTGELIEVTPEVYSKIAYRQTTEGIIGLAHWKDHSLSNLKLRSNPLILIAENIEKPGNIGAMLRTADASGLDAFIIANPITDLYNPNIIRSSVGGIFTVQIGIASTQEIIDWLRQNKINLYSATLQNSTPYYTVDYTKPAAIAVGSEAQGLNPPFRQAAKQNIIIPMRGQLDSLNVSVSAAIIVFEAVRQRQTKRTK